MGHGDDTTPLQCSSVHQAAVFGCFTTVRARARVAPQQSQQQHSQQGEVDAARVALWAGYNFHGKFSVRNMLRRRSQP